MFFPRMDRQFISAQMAFISFIFFAIVALFASLATAGEDAGKVNVANFSAGDLTGWEEESFKEHSQYDFVLKGSVLKGGVPVESVTADSVADQSQNTSNPEVKVLRARTQGQASGLFKEVRIDLRETPFLNWSWQVQNLFEGNDEKTKEGDDYPARIYVLVSGGIFFWNTKAINYVWSSNQPVGSEWPNAYTGNARMLAVRSGEEQVGQWVNERRNIREDLQRLFGEDITNIDAVAVMVDGDNTGQSASSYFGDIFFSKQ